MSKSKITKLKPTKALRTVAEPRVAEILAAFDRVAQAPDRCDSDLCTFMSCVAGTVIDRFTIPAEWGDAGIRAVLVAFLAHAPAEDLAEMLDSARQYMQVQRETEAEAAEVAPPPPPPPPPHVEAALAAAKKLVATWCEADTDPKLPMAAILDTWCPVLPKALEGMLELLIVSAAGVDELKPLAERLAREQRAADQDLAQRKLADRLADVVHDYDLADRLALEAREAFA